MAVSWTPALKAEYQKLFDTCTLNPGRERYAIEAVKQIVAGKARYEPLAKKVGCPWWVVGLIHKMEANCRFNAHLHNGDPLTAKTVHVPANRPASGTPPFTFEQSALDAMINVKGFNKITDWSVAHILFVLEGYNGYGYHFVHPPIPSPYLWSFTNHYKAGKYVKDGVYSATAVSQQLGIAAIIKHGFLTKAFA